jgi:dihydrofolate synthase/folylpolyglutamate synthase
MDYAEALAFLNSLADYERAAPRRYDTTAFDLGRFRELLARLGDPQAAYPIVHVAGTKGKGSACAMLGGAFQAAGRKVGLFTSPHLRSVRERITLDDELIPPAAFGASVAAARAEMRTGGEPNYRTFFETLLAAALVYFRAEGAAVAVLETGLGGRLDATNVVAPAVTTITTIELDHTEILGETLAAVAREKAGIIKARVPAVTSPQPPEALAEIRAAAATAATSLTVVGKDVSFRPRSDGAFDYRGPRYDLAAVRPAMAAAAQQINGAAVLATLELFRPFEVPAAAARAGVERARLRARAELIPGAPTVLLDASHTAGSAAELAAVVRTLAYKPVILLWGMSAEKDMRAYAAALAPVVDAAVATAAATNRARAAHDLVAATWGEFKNLEAVADVAAAWDRARELAGPSGLVVAAGSFYLAGEVLTILEGPVA